MKRNPRASQPDGLAMADIRVALRWLRLADQAAAVYVRAVTDADGHPDVPWREWARDSDRGGGVDRLVRAALV